MQWRRSSEVAQIADREGRRERERRQQDEKHGSSSSKKDLSHNKPLADACPVGSKCGTGGRAPVPESKQRQDAGISSREIRNGPDWAAWPPAVSTFWSR